MEELNNDILQLRFNLEVGLANVISVIELNNNVIEIANQKLAQAGSELGKINAGGGAKQKIANAQKMLGGLSKNKQILTQQAVIREQVIVLFVGSLESYLTEVINMIGNVFPELFKFKDTNEKITFTQEMLKSGFKLGDAITEHIFAKGYSFQDLKSSLGVFDDYLGIHIELTDQSRDSLILCAATRNCVVHNNSRASRQFLKQVRSTKYADRYKLDDLISVDDEFISSSREAILEFADQITAAVVGDI